jgi:hypothetical protein
MMVVVVEEEEKGWDKECFGGCTEDHNLAVFCLLAVDTDRPTVLEECFLPKSS